MEKIRNQEGKIKLITLVTIVIIFAVILFGFVAYNYYFKNSNNSENVTNTNNTMNTSTNVQNVTTNTEESKKILSDTKFIEIEVPDTEAPGLKYKPAVKVEDKEVIRTCEDMVNTGIEYKPRGTVWPDITPEITFYTKAGDMYEVFAIDGITEADGEDAGNYITVLKNSNEDTKKMYKINKNLEEYASNMYNKYKATKEELSKAELEELTKYLNKIENNGFVVSEYDNVRNINLQEILYNGAEMQEENTDKLLAEWKDAFGEEAHVGIVKYTTKQLTHYLKEKTGETYYDLKTMMEDAQYTYSEKYDAYYTEHGDSNVETVTCNSGNKEGHIYTINGTLNKKGKFTLVLKKVDNGYQFVSNELVK